jgi:hypothetical protein
VPVREDVEPFSLGERLEVANDDQPRAEAFEPRDELPIADRPVAPTMSLRVRGSVNDLDRKVGLADFELVIDDGVREPETLVTDAEGRFASALDYAAGELAITLLDRAGTESLEFFDGGFVREVPPVVELVTWSPGEELKLSAAVGRSVSVTVQGRSPAPPPWFASVESDSLCWRNASVQFERAPVRAGSSPWFRLAARSLKRVASADRLTVSLTSDDGLWYGVGTVRETSALVKIESRARLDVELSRSDGEPIVSPDIEVRAVDTDCILRADSRWDGSRVVRGESPMRFVFRALERGEYDVVARARGCPPVSKRVKLLNGKVTLAKLVLGPSRGASSIRGELRSNTGDFATAVTVSITSLEERDARPLTQRCEFRRERGEMVAAFDFAGVAPGKYAIQLVKNGARHERWLPTPTTVDAPADGLVFVCQDDETLIDLRLRALQFDTDGPLGIARWRYVIDGVPFSGQGPELVIEGVSPRSAFEWCVTAQGFGVVCGDWDEFFPAGKESFCEARLRRGWGAKIRTVDDRTRVPVADVGIWLDGELAGHTDDDGVLLVDRRERPNRLEAGLAGWRLTSEARKLGVVVDDEARMVLVLPMSPQL